MADNKPKVDTKDISSDLTKAVTMAITEGFKNAASSFSNLSKDLSSAITEGFKGGTEKSKKYFEGKTLLEAMKEDLKEMAQFQKENAFQAQVQAKSLMEGISTREAEIKLLAEQKIGQNNLLIQAQQRHVAELGIMKLYAIQAGDDGLVKAYDRKIKKANELVGSLQKENKQTEDTAKHLTRKIKLQRELEEQDRKKQAVNDKMKEVKKNLLDQLGITEKLIDQFKTPEMAKAVFAEQMGEKIHDAYENFEEFKKMGLSSGQAVQGMFKGMNIYSMLGLSDTKGVLEGVVEEYGNINALSRETVGELGHMAHEMGITGQEALKVNASLSRMPGETSESAANAMKVTGALAKANGIAPGKIMKDMAKNSELMALGGYKTAKAFGEAAIKAQKMGVDLSTTKNVMSGLLNFEDSINKQMEASVLLGREINLDKARELALQGKSVEATEEVLKQVGGAAALDKMNVKQKEALAAATGMTVEELQKAADAQEEHNKYFGEGAGITSRAIGSVMEYGGAAVGFLKQNAMLLMSGAQLLANENAMKLLGNIYEKAKIALGLIYQGIMWAINGLLNSRFLINAKDFVVEQGKKVLAVAQLGLAQARLALETFLNNTKMGMWVKEKAQWALEKAHFAWKKAQSALGIGGGAAGAATKTAAGAAGGAAEKLANAGGGKQTGGLTGAIEKIDAKKLLAGAAALVLVAAAVYVFAKAAQEFTSVPWSSIGKAIVAMLALVGALALVGMIMMSGVGAVAILAGAAAMLIMAAALFVLGKAMQEIAIGFDMFIPSLLQLAPMSGDILLLGAGFLVLGAGLIAFAAASIFAVPGMVAIGYGLGVVAVGLGLVALAGAAVLPVLTGLTALAAMAPMFTELAGAITNMAVGLMAFASAGIFTLPTIAGLIALSLVAPVLIALGKSIQFDLGGGSKVEGGEGGKENDKMDVLIGKIDQLIAVASKGGTINMDGKKVGEVVRLSINSSGVR